jgi:hypothetical protein
MSSIDLADLRRKQQAAREFTVTVGSASYVLRLPTAHEKEVHALRARGTGSAADPALPALLVRQLLEAAIVGWSGVTAEKLAPGGGTEPVDLVPGAAALLLDNDPDTAVALTQALVLRENERNHRVDAAEKN